MVMSPHKTKSQTKSKTSGAAKSRFDALHSFLQMMAVERNAARTTLEAYEGDLEDLAAHARPFWGWAGGDLAAWFRR